MKCTACEGRGWIAYFSNNYLDGDNETCDECYGTGEVYSPNDAQSWDSDHPGWKRFDAHKASKWKNRFVLSGCDGKYQDIVKLLKTTTRLDYEYILFSEEKLFPGQDVTYMYPCVYFFPITERDSSTPVTKSELEELYWY